MASQNVLEFSTDTWQQDVLGSDTPVLVDFWASWCGPCRMIAPTIEQLATDYAGRVKVGKLNVDDHPDLASEYGIHSIPQVYIFKGGKLVEKVPGAQSKSVFQAAIERSLSAS